MDLTLEYQKQKQKNEESVLIMRDFPEAPEQMALAFHGKVATLMNYLYESPYHEKQSCPIEDIEMTWRQGYNTLLTYGILKGFDKSVKSIEVSIYQNYSYHDIFYELMSNTLNSPGTFGFGLKYYIGLAMKVGISLE